MYTFLSRSIVIVALIGAGMLGGVSVALAYTENSAVPPLGDVPAPINVGTTSQTKTGTLRILNGLFSGSGGTAFGDGTIRVNQGWSPDQELTINSNQIWKTNTTGDANLYLQWSTPGGAVWIGGQAGAKNDLRVASGTAYANQFCINGGACTTNFSGGTNYWTLTGPVLSNNSGSEIDAYSVVKTLNPNVGSGSALLSSGTTVQAGYLAWYTPSGNRQAYLGWDPNNLWLNLEKNNTGGQANFIIANGSVGIGTSNVNGVTTISAGSDRMLNFRGDPSSFGTSQGGIILQGVNSAQTAEAPITLEGSSLYLNPTGGSVGIRTTAPAASSLTVDNSAHTMQICLNGTDATHCTSSITGGGANYWVLGQTFAANDTLYNAVGPSIIRAQNGTTVGNGYAYIAGGTASNAGYLGIVNPAGTRLGYLGWDPTNLNINLASGVNLTVTNGNAWFSGSIGIGGTSFSSNNLYLGSNGNIIAADIKATGKIGTQSNDPNSGYPTGWAGGVHTFDVQADGSVSAQQYCTHSNNSAAATCGWNGSYTYPYTVEQGTSSPNCPYSYNSNGYLVSTYGTQTDYHHVTVTVTRGIITNVNDVSTQTCYYPNTDAYSAGDTNANLSGGDNGGSGAGGDSGF